MSWRLSSLRVAFILVAAGTVVPAQPLEEWFQNKDHNFRNRWEGLFGQNQGSPAWEVRSFLASVESYPMNSSVDLRVAYYVPDSTEAFLKAQTIKGDPSYFMEPKPEALKKQAGWRDFGGWPTGDVLIKQQISGRDLGMLIRLGADSDAVNVFAPATVYHSSRPKTVQTYRFDLFSVRALATFSFDVVGSGYKRTYKDHPGTGAVSTVPIEFYAPEIPEGWTKVVLSPKYQGSDKGLNLEWKFYNKRP